MIWKQLIDKENNMNNGKNEHSMPTLPRKDDELRIELADGADGSERSGEKVDDDDDVASYSEAALAAITNTTASLTIIDGEYFQDDDDADSYHDNNGDSLNLKEGTVDAPAATAQTTVYAAKAGAVAASKVSVVRAVETDATIPNPSTVVVSYDRTGTARWMEERDEVSRLYVGRIIGKGGEMIRDLQARSGCRIDVHQDIADDLAPRVISYRGRRQEDIDLARNLVAMLCSTEPRRRGSSGGNNDNDEQRQQQSRQMHSGLPLGRAVMRQVHVPNSIVGRIIGRGGETIRDLQCKSRARIQVDHTPDEHAESVSNSHYYRRVTITGTEEAVSCAEDMILRMSNMVVTHHGKAGSDLPLLPVGVDGDYIESGGSLPYLFGQAYYCHPPEQLQQQHATMPSSMYPYASVIPNLSPPPHPPDSPTDTIETDTMSCDKSNIGHIIGRRGTTINDLQRRSACNIQIDQISCTIYITGPRLGIELARRMLDEIFQCGADHPFSGGRQQQQISQHLNDARPLQESLRGGYNSRSRSFNIQGSYGYIPYPTPSQPMMPVQQQQQLPYSRGIHSELLCDSVLPTAQGLASSPSMTTAETVPNPWMMGTTPEGTVYYYNLNTLETQWDEPAAMKSMGD